MKLLEYEAKEILKRYHLPTPTSVLVNSPDDLAPIPTVLKSQVPVGGRGKAGGVQIVTKQSDLKPLIHRLLKLPIKAFTPTRLLAEELIDIDREYYLSLLINREEAVIELVANSTGGVDVEENDSDSFLRIPLSSASSLVTGEQLAEYYNLPNQTFALQDFTKNLLDCFQDSDATMLEINPLILTKQGKLVVGDCKMELDNSAAFRHPEWKFEETITDVNFVTIHENGVVATIANGAGLGMATVDAVAEAGLEPANFLDIGGGATSESVLAAFEKIVAYPNIQAIVINIFAGITRCDEVAKAIIAATKKIDTLPPLYVRLAGTNFEQAAELLKNENIPLQPTLDACLTAVKSEVSS